MPVGPLSNNTVFGILPPSRNHREPIKSNSRWARARAARACFLDTRAHTTRAVYGRARRRRRSREKSSKGLAKKIFYLHNTSHDGTRGMLSTLWANGQSTQPTAPIKVSWQATPVAFLHGWLLPSCDSKHLL